MMLDNGTVSYNLTAYYELECATGYRGNLCGRCEPGYGRSGSGKCTQCASRALNTLWYIFCSLINIVFIVIVSWPTLAALLSIHRNQQLHSQPRVQPSWCTMPCVPGMFGLP